jgi:hypothetical protein
LNLAHLGAYEKLGLFALFMVIFVFVAPKAMGFFMGSVASIATTRRPPGVSAPPREAVRRGAERSGATDLGFGRDAVEAVGGDWQTASTLNAALVRMQQQRNPAITRQGDILQSKVAWKVAVSAQAALYRLVALADAATTLWNFRNPLGAIITATAFLESAAAFAAFENTLTHLTEAGDLPAIDTFIMRTGFSNGLDGIADAAQSRTAAPIGALSASAQTAYVQLAAIADAHALTNYRVFGALDKTNTSVAFIDSESFDKAVLDQLLAAVSVIETLGERFAALEALLPKVAALTT